MCVKIEQLEVRSPTNNVLDILTRTRMGQARPHSTNGDERNRRRHLLVKKNPLKGAIRVGIEFSRTLRGSGVRIPSIDW